MGDIHTASKLPDDTAGAAMHGTPTASIHPERSDAVAIHHASSNVTRSTPDPCLAILGIVWLILLPVWTSIPSDRALATPPAAARHTIDPNTAPWWELTTLPSIGPATAYRIIEFRQAASAGSPTGPDSRAFRCAADLDAVPGVGPQTLRRIGPHLHF